ncbi:MAG: ATP-dependent DNA helicase [Nanoarchaeota archaeon]|nr:ATP-dependent DNA helicase [Nanoarchaeota archaeon]
MKFFPYAQVRKHQDAFIKDVNETLEKKKILLANAPTGIGKTAAVLSPAIEYAIKHDKTIFFLTPRHTQHKVVIETLRLIHEKGINFSAIDIIGKKWMCAIPGSTNLNSTDFSQLCKQLRENNACKYYEASKKNKNVLTEILHVEEAVEQLTEQGLCPYYTTIAFAKKAKVIIGDYYHVFSENTRKALFKHTEKELKDAILIIDEAHNLPGRIRELLSARTSNLSLSLAFREAQKYNKQTADTIQQIGNALKNKGDTMHGEEGLIHREWFLQELEESLTTTIENFLITLEKIAEKTRENKKNSYCGALADFIENWMTQHEEYVRFIRRESFKGKEYYSLNNNCLSPAIITSNVLKSSHSTILMSGTLQPLEMYADLLGTPNAILKKYESPFPKKNRTILIVPETTTKYSKRSENEYKNIAEKCVKIINSQKVNTAIFFPSYALKNDIYQYIRDTSEKTIFIERQNMTKQEKTEMIEKFKKYSQNGGATLLGVISGNFAEGIDYPGEFLQMIIVVGIPLAKPNLNTRAIIQYYQNSFGKGWEYGYTYPAITKVLQASGRAIRSENDKGAIILLDERYIHENYLPSLPEDVEITTKPVEKINKFFNKNIIENNYENINKNFETKKIE